MRYGIAVVVVVLALLLTRLLQPWIAGESPLLLALVAIMLSTVYGGLGPGLLATTVASVLGDYFLFTPGTLLVQPLDHNVRLGLFVLASLLSIWISQALAAAKRLAAANLWEVQRQRELSRSSEAQFRQLAEHIREIFWLFDCEQQQVTYVSPAYAEIWERTPESLYADPSSFLQAIHPDDRPRVSAALAHRHQGDYDVTYRILRPSGDVRWIRDRAFPIHNAMGIVYRIAGIAEDITAQHVVQQQLEHLALYDALTGLPNRVLFMDRLRQALAHAERHPTAGFAVLFLDLDRFKTINDSLGHLLGDQLLIGIAQRVAACLRSIHTVARLGGDEFAILLTEMTDRSEALQIAERIHQHVAEPFQFSGHEVVTSASIGIVLSTSRYGQPEELLRDADLALYRAKAQGKACSVIFDHTMHKHAMARLALESGLRRAIQREELQLYYQPVVALASGQIMAVEALVRWHDPVRGVVPPAQFIPLAEETGLIALLEEWVVRTACRQVKAWQAAGFPHLGVAVNLSAHQFHQRDVGTLIATSLSATGLDASCLTLELTESSLIEHADATTRMLQAVKALGVQLALDDFGTGYSSLSYLKRFPIDTVKIDRSFVHDIPSDPNDAALAKAIIAMAHSLNVQVIAEGVETAAQLEFLQAHQADAIQGYLISRPVPAEMLVQLLLEDCLVCPPSSIAHPGHNGQV